MPPKIARPFFSPLGGWTLIAPNGERLQFTSREAAWQAYYQIKKGI